MIRRSLHHGARLALLAALLLAVLPAQAASPAAVDQGTPYTVRSGDTWSVIASMFGVSADRLIDFNGLRSRPDLIFVGEVIRIPITVGFTPSYINPFYYTVQTGDTVQSIVDRYELDKTAFLTANGLASDSVALTPGDVLLIPAGPHRVVIDEGETLAAVAARYHTTVDRLLLFNPHLVNPSAVYPGNNVFVPIQYNVAFVSATDVTGSAATTVTTPTSAIPAVSVGTQLTAAVTAANGSTQYVVQRGDAWPRLERMFGVSAATLIDSNNLRTRPDLLFAGETITIPISLGFVPSFVNPFLYVVQAGDTIQALVNAFEIDKTSLLSSNGLSTSLDNNTPLTVGETLLIPAGPHRTTVQRGQTLEEIAARYSTTTSRLMTFNSHLTQPPLAGQSVFIPTQLDAVFVPATGIIVGTDGATTGDTTTTTATTPTIADPGGTLTIRWVAVRTVVRDPDFAKETGKVIVTLAVEFRGGQAPFTLLHEGVETTYVGPTVRTDNDVDYTNLDYEVKVVCGGPIVAGVEVRSADGQTATHTYWVTTTCPFD